MSTTTLHRIAFILLVTSVVLASEYFFYDKHLHLEVVHFIYSKETYKTLIYFASYSLALGVYSAFILVRSRILFSAFCFLLFASYSVATCYTLINGYGFGLAEMQTISNEANKHIHDVLSGYRKFILISAVVTILILILTLLLRKYARQKNLLVSSKATLSITLISLLTSLAISYKTTNTTNKPSVFIDFYITYFYYKANPIYYGPREVLSKNPTEQEAYKNIIWIIDESVSANHLSINGFGKNSTPYLESIKQSYINLGVASSAANCSAASNIILMSGIQVDQLPDSDNYSLKAPSIFQYAKNAGYKTHYISGQSHGDLLQNNMTPYDLRSIDNFYQPSKSYKEEYAPESDITKKTKAALSSNEKNFIFIVKRGAHFEWKGKYPEHKNHFRPALDNDDVFELKNKEKAVNSYLNLVKYRTDDFFKHFFDSTKLLNNNEALIIYTSDHGQSILENNKTGTHCDSSEPNPSQGSVPLLVFANKNKEKLDVLGKNKFSHFEIFPTTLELMGYEKHNRGKTFFNKTDGEQIFFSGDLFGRSTANFNPIATAK